MTGNRWLASARAAHTRALGSPQAFPLFGDGAHTASVRGDDKLTIDAERSGAALAEARYRDWYTARATGQTAYAPRSAAYEAPPLALAPDDAPAAVQTRLALPARARDDRLAEATLIIRGLVAEFSDLFPDELAAAMAWLSR